MHTFKVYLKHIVAHSKWVWLETEVSDLRQGYLLLNRRYSVALGSLKELNAHACEAAKRSALGATKAVEAAYE